MAVPLRQYDYDYDYAYEPQYHRRRPSGSRRVIWFILFLIITWFSLPPWGSVDTEILSHEMDANNTCLYTTIKVENNTHTFAYQVQTVVYLTDGQGNNVASKTEKVAAVMLPGARKSSSCIWLYQATNKARSALTHIHRAGRWCRPDCQRGIQRRRYRTRPSNIQDGYLRAFS